MIRVKICGNRTIEDVLISIACGADAVGLIVGTMYYSEDNISPNYAGEILKKIPPFVSTVLVTHLQSSSEIIDIYRQATTSTIQLHNDISIEEIKAIRQAIPYVKIIKAVSIIDESAIDVSDLYKPFVDAILLDSRTTNRIGGTGKTHDWSISKEITSRSDKPIILAGGLNPENVMQAIEYVQPFGVDVNSGVDSFGGEKNLQKLRDFIYRSKYPQRVNDIDIR